MSNLLLSGLSGILCLNSRKSGENLLLLALIAAFFTTAFGQQSSVELQRSKFNGDWVYSAKDNKKKAPQHEGWTITINYSEPRFQIEETRIVNKKTRSEVRIFLTDGSEETDPGSALVPLTEIEPKTRWDQSVLLHQYNMIFHQVEPPYAKNVLRMDFAEEYRVSEDSNLLYVTHEGTITYEEKGKKGRNLIIYRRKT